MVINIGSLADARDNNHNRGSYNSDRGRDNYRGDNNNSRGGYNSDRYNGNNNNNRDGYNDRGSYNSDRGNGRSNYNNNSYSRPVAQRGEIRGTVTFAPREPKCRLCNEKHWLSSCTNFTTPAAKRAKLIEMGNRDKCSYVKRADHVCRLKYLCSACNTGVHLDYLCPGQAQSNTS